MVTGLDKQTLIELLTADDLIVFSEMQVCASDDVDGSAIPQVECQLLEHSVLASDLGQG